MTAIELLASLNTPKTDDLFFSLYGRDETEAARLRYRSLFEDPLLKGDLRVFSIPGRTELGGNHTDHNNGKVLAASIHLDIVAVVASRKDKKIFLRSSGHRDASIDLKNLAPKEEEKGKTEALIRGVAAEFAAQGTEIGGLTIIADSLVMPGSGLSSSAVVEIMLARIFDSYFGEGKRNSLELAILGQRAENLYFGKPCGLMDQIACANGGGVYIDFADSENPQVQSIDFDPAASGMALCIVDSLGSHSDLTTDYASIPGDMKAVASFFKKNVLREVDEELFRSSFGELRKKTGDRAIQRALHFFNENRRVDAMFEGLKKNNIALFLELVNESGSSSMQLLQNIHSGNNPKQQSLCLALSLTSDFLNLGGGKTAGACRVHGGGFAGTIQAYIPGNRIEEYRNLMEGIFGEGTMTVLNIRPFGPVEIILKELTDK